MKKKLTLLVSLLLCLSMLLASCGDPSDKNPPNLPPDDPDGGKTPAQLESEANALYKASLGEWLKYIEYEAPEVSANPDVIKEYVGSFKDDADYSYDLSGNLAVFKKTVNKIHEYTVPAEPPADPSADPVPPTVEKYSYQLRTITLLDLTTGKELKTWSIIDYAIGGAPAKYAPDLSREDHVVYDIELLLDGAVIEVSKTVFVKRELTELEKADAEFELDLTLDSSWNEKTTYSYYDNTATALAENLEDSANVRGSLIDIDASTYVTLNGEIIRKFALGMELPLPNLEPDEPNPLYDYFSSGDYHYLVTEKPMQITPIGDLVLYMVPGVSIQILDKEYKIVTEYISDSYAIMGYAVLPNGDVYVCEYEKLESDATEYDFLQGEEKMNAMHTVISASEPGKVTTLDKGFVAQKIYTEPMTSATTPLQQAMQGDFPGGVCPSLKDGYMLASIQKFADGVLSSDSVIAVLNGSLEIVAELPKVLPNQFGYVSFLNEDQALVSSNVKFGEDGSSIIYYAVDTATGDLELFPKDLDDVIAIDGGYIYEESWNRAIVYDYNWNKLYTIEDKESYEIVDGYILITRVDGSYTYYYTGAIVEKTQDNGGYDDGEPSSNVTKVYEFEKTAVNGNSSGLNPWVGNRFFEYRSSSGDVYIYNLKNETVFNFDSSESRQLTEMVEDVYCAVFYGVSRSFYIEELIDGVYCLVITESWNRTSYSGYTDLEQIPYPESDTFVSYYIIK